MTLTGESNVTEAKRTLRAEGRRITAQRELLLEIIEEAGGHLDADEIFLLAKQRDPRLSLSTVYRTLNVLKETGLVGHHYHGRDHNREYFESSGGPEHYHFTCVACGQVIEFETPLIERLRQDLKRQHGIRIRYASLCFEGYCSNCQTQVVEVEEKKLR